ncbi:glycerophosphodiester phosphodiesterase GDPD2-like [Telopea speciosissima]|uniref:glycerophosphodiester phosphodiesterase GDPD2-like n=1 Tax=Telopea speciosissima TaxID=54955 RepID=UPI001CC69273|nr:glycerophosphodiester phosphodiesterase GDPD2-like [Telopea speciosissima]
MALKAVHFSHLRTLNQVRVQATMVAIYSSRFSKVNDGGQTSLNWSKFLVIGHRGSGMNVLESSDRRMKEIKENSILSFNTAGEFAVDFIEFDVQVTKDDYPVIFHDNFILTEEENGEISERRLTELTLDEFVCCVPQTEPANVGKTLLRRTEDQRILSWKVEQDDALCTLQEAFQKVNPSLGFNIELKFDDDIVYQDEELIHVIQAILRVVFEYAKERAIIFSTFQPDAARLIRVLQSTYPVFFLTDGGSEIYTDVRRNSLEEALKLCLACGLQGIVSEVKAILRNQRAINNIREANLSLLTYGQLNNVPQAVYFQHLAGVDGVIVDMVPEITASISDYMEQLNESKEDSLSVSEGDGQIKTLARHNFLPNQLSLLLKLDS